MNKQLKRIAIVLLIFGLLVSLAGCGPSSDLKFKNNTDATIHGLHITPSTDDEWGEKLNSDLINKGRTFGFNFSDIGTTGPGTYDLGTIDENKLCCDVFEIELKEGDSIELTCIGQMAVVVVTSKDGSTQRYEGVAYEETE